MKTVLTIAGSDPSGGAGIQADLATFQALGVQGVTAITALTAQNEKRFFSVNPVASRLLKEQLHAVSDGRRFDAIKIGMLATEENVLAVCRFLEGRGKVKVVLDPVFKSSTGAVLLEPKGIVLLKTLLIPRVSLITPNLEEAERLTGRTVRSLDTMKEAALHLHAAHSGLGAVLVKGGHLKEEATDVLYDGRDWRLFPAKQHLSRGAHGTGCVLSAAITAFLAHGHPLEESIERAKEHVERYIRNPSSVVA